MAFSIASAAASFFAVYRRSIAAEAIAPSGFAIFFPAISGAEPCTGSYRSTSPPIVADASMPSEPVNTCLPVSYTHLLIEEMSQVLDMYLHRSGISQPIEYFHSLFLSSYRQEPTSLWMIQEDDPDHFRFISDEGEETVSPRFAGSDPASRTPSNGSSDCSACEFETRCGGYFKWPDADYNCRGVKILFATIEAAAEELRGDVASMIAVQGGPQPL